MNQADVLAGIALAFSNPLVQVVIAVLIIGLIPNKVLVRIPVVGPIVQVWLDTWALKKLTDFAKQRSVLDEEADRIVREKEQAIKMERLDQASARATSVLEMQQKFNVPVGTANLLVEAAVNRMNQDREFPSFSGVLTDYEPMEAGRLTN